jgi:hypothetical protein
VKHWDRMRWTASHVQQWFVWDCTRAEQLIHEALNQDRLSDDREFFKADYQASREIIDQVLLAVNGPVARQ